MFYIKSLPKFITVPILIALVQLLGKKISS